MSTPISRRQLLSRLAVAGATGAFASILAACGGDAAPTTTVAPAAPATTTAAGATKAPVATTGGATATTGGAAATTGSGVTSAPATSGGSGTAAPKLSGAVEFWSRETQNNGARQPLIQARLAAFDQANGTTSKAQFMVFQESVQKTQAAFAAGNPPNLGQQGPDVSLQFAAGGNLLPLDDLFTSLKDQYLPLQKEAFVNYGAKTYAVPWWTETRVLFYHKDLLEKAGVKPPTTWAEWLDAAKALTKGDDQYGFIMGPEGPGAGPCNSNKQRCVTVARPTATRHTWARRKASCCSVSP